MKKSHCLVSIAAVLAALVVGGSAGAATDCLSIELSSPSSACAGQLASISATITNSCPTPERVTASFTLDQKTLPVSVSFGVAGDSTMSKQLTVPVPASASPSSHTLTVNLADKAGDEASATLDLSVSSCAAN